MYQTLVVIDDFLDFAPKIREAALAMNYPELEGEQYFPGRNAEKAVTIRGLDELIGNIVGEKLVPAEGTSHGKFRLALEGDKGAGGVHVDKCDWSGILFLTDNENCRDGTNFFKHKVLNTDRAPLNRDDLNAMGLESFEQFWNDYLLIDGADPDKWELITHIPMRFNRLILFRPWLFHNAGVSFGKTPEVARLIFPLFYTRSTN